MEECQEDARSRRCHTRGKKSYRIGIRNSTLLVSRATKMLYTRVWNAGVPDLRGGLRCLLFPTRWQLVTSVIIAPVGIMTGQWRDLRGSAATMQVLWNAPDNARSRHSGIRHQQKECIGYLSASLRQECYFNRQGPLQSAASRTNQNGSVCRLCRSGGSSLVLNPPVCSQAAAYIRLTTSEVQAGAS